MYMLCSKRDNINKVKQTNQINEYAMHIESINNYIKQSTICFHYGTINTVKIVLIFGLLKVFQ